MPKLHINDNGVWKVIDAGNADLLEGKTKTEVLQEAAAASTPNILINTDVLHAVNQRNFNGNWGNLAVGGYGYDRWLKSDAANKGQIVEAGNFVPSATYTLAYNVGNARTYMAAAAPASGHWLIEAPFAADKLDLYLGSIRRPWVPEDRTDVVAKCHRYHFVADYSGVAFLIEFYQVGKGYNLTFIAFSDKMRKTPTVSTVAWGDSGGLDSRVLKSTPDGSGVFVQSRKNASEGSAYTYLDGFTVDAELTLNDL